MQQRNPLAFSYISPYIQGTRRIKRITHNLKVKSPCIKVYRNPFPLFPVFLLSRDIMCKFLPRLFHTLRKKEMMKIYTKRFFYILHPRIIIIFYTRYKYIFFKIKMNLYELTRLLRSIVHKQSLARTNFISFVFEKDFRVSYFDKKKLSCIL